MYQLFLAAIALVLMLIAIAISYEVVAPTILSSDVLLYTDLPDLRQRALTPFINTKTEQRLHGGNPLGMYNMSVRRTDEGYSGVIRGSSYDGCRSWNYSPLFSYSYSVKLSDKAEILDVALLDLDYESMKLCSNIMINANGIEDSKLFMYRGEEWVVANMLGSPHQPHVCVNIMCIFKLSNPKDTFMMITAPPHIGTKVRQKNWGMFEYDGRLLCEYSIEPHIVLEVNMTNGTTTEIANTGELKHDVLYPGSLRGGACPILIHHEDKDYYLGVGHVRHLLPSDYLHFFYMFEAQPPFALVAITDFFKVDQKARIQFAAGLSEYQDKFHISYGVEDCDNRISIIDKQRLLALMHPYNI